VTNKIRGERRRLIILGVCPAELNHYAPFFDIAGIKQSLLERRYDGESSRLRPAVQARFRELVDNVAGGGCALPLFCIAARKKPAASLP